MVYCWSSIPTANPSKFQSFCRGRFRQFTTHRQAYEAVLELNHWFYIRPGLYLTPLAQWIINPGATSTLPDALVLGFQITAIL